MSKWLGVQKLKCTTLQSQAYRTADFNLCLGEGAVVTRLAMILLKLQSAQRNARELSPKDPWPKTDTLMYAGHQARWVYITFRLTNKLQQQWPLLSITLQSQGKMQISVASCTEECSKQYSNCSNKICQLVQKAIY